MLPGYGFSPLPDFQPHLHAFCCRGESSAMWIPGSPESQALNNSQENRPLLRQHIAVCQQETLAFIDLQQPKTNGFCSSSSLGRRSSLPCTSGLLHNRPSSNYCQNGETHANTAYVKLGQDGHDVEEVQDKIRAPCVDSLKTDSEKLFPQCSPKDLFLPLSPMFVSRNRDSVDSQQPSSPCSSASSELQSHDQFCLQRRTSQGSSKEKSIRKWHHNLATSWHIRVLERNCGLNGVMV